MRRWMELRALIVTAIVVIAVVVAFLTIDGSRETAPVKRAQEQNSGANAPLERNASPGTVPQPDGSARLPENQQ